MTINGEEIETTPWHLFLTQEGWTEAEDLREGDVIVSLGGVYGTVDSVIIENTVQTMYDLTVEDVHNFAVGEGDWVVHNNNLPCNISKTTFGSETDVTYSSNDGERIARFTYDSDTESLSVGLIHTRDNNGNPRFSGISGSNVVDNLFNVQLEGQNINEISYYSSTSRDSLSGNMNALSNSLNGIYNELVASGLPRSEWPQPNIPSLVAQQTPLGRLFGSRGFTDLQVTTYIQGNSSPQTITWNNFRQFFAISVTGR